MKIGVGSGDSFDTTTSRENISVESADSTIGTNSLSINTIIVNGLSERNINLNIISESRVFYIFIDILYISIFYTKVARDMDSKEFSKKYEAILEEDFLNKLSILIERSVILALSSAISDTYNRHIPGKEKLQLVKTKHYKKVQREIFDEIEELIKKYCADLSRAELIRFRKDDDYIPGFKYAAKHNIPLMLRCAVTGREIKNRKYGKGEK